MIGALHTILAALIYIHSILLSHASFHHSVVSVNLFRSLIFTRPLSSTIHIGLGMPSLSISSSHTSHIQSLSVSVCVGL